MARSSASPLRQLRAVLFDADHTLFDTDRAERAALKAALGELRIAFSAAALHAYREINSSLWQEYQRGRLDTETLSRERFCRLLTRLGGDPLKAPELARLYLDSLSSRGDLLPGCRSTLSKLRRRYGLGLVTNGLDQVQRSRLHAARLEDAFGVVVTSEACGYTKPDPRILHVALEALDVLPEQALYVGDSLETDAAAAAAAKVAFCWIVGRAPTAPMHRRPRLQIVELRELAPLLDSL